MALAMKSFKKTYLIAVAVVLSSCIGIAIVFLILKFTQKERTLPRNDIAEKLLNKRKSKDNPSDVTFELNWASKNWKYFAEEHYDWWMFPWKADRKDSEIGQEWSILEGDVIDLLNTPGFLEKYVRGAEILIDTFVESSKAINPVVKLKGNSVHPARYSKIFCSLEYFERGANYIGDKSKAAKLNEIKEKLVKTFGAVTFQYEDKKCDMHVWNV